MEVYPALLEAAPKVKEPFLILSLTRFWMRGSLCIYLPIYRSVGLST